MHVFPPTGQVAEPHISVALVSLISGFKSKWQQQKGTQADSRQIWKRYISEIYIIDCSQWSISLPASVFIAVIKVICPGQCWFVCTSPPHLICRAPPFFFFFTFIFRIYLRADGPAVEAFLLLGQLFFFWPVMQTCSDVEPLGIKQVVPPPLVVWCNITLVCCCVQLLRQVNRAHWAWKWAPGFFKICQSRKEICQCMAVPKWA